MKFFHDPLNIQVRNGSNGEPVSFTSGKKVEKVSRIANRWRISREWWRKEVSREYFQVETGRGSICEIYCDLLTQSWYLQRICD
jgi:hypothetical protein